MKFTGEESERITLKEAIEWTSTFRKEHPNETKAWAFGIHKIKAILAQKDCMGIRAYNAIDDNGKHQLVWVGITADGKDMYEGVILERSVPCPNVCDMKSPLCE